MGLSGAGGGAAPNLPVDSVSESQEAIDALGGSSASNSSLGLGDLGSGIGAIQGILSGSPQGYLSAGANLSKLAGQASGTTGLSAAGGYLGGALSIYNGIQQGGVVGDGKAALGATSLGASAGAFGGASAAVGAVAAPVAVAAGLMQAGLALGDAWTAKTSTGNTAMTDWMKATGSKWVPNAAQQTNGGAWGGENFNAYASGNVSPGTMYDSSGKVISPTEASADIYQWATSNGVNPGDFKG